MHARRAFCWLAATFRGFAAVFLAVCRALLAVSDMPANVETRAAKRRRYEEGAKQSWESLPTGPLTRIFELAQALPGGSSVVRTARGVNRDWRQVACELLMDDTACSRPPRPPALQAAAHYGIGDATAADYLRNPPFAGDAQGLNTPTPQLPGLAASIKVEPAPAEQHGGAHEDNAAASGLADSQKSDANHGQQQESAPPVHALHPVGLPPLRMQTRGAVRAAAAAQRVPEHGQGSHSAPPG